MYTEGKNEDLSEKIQIALDHAIKKVIEDARARNDYLVIADTDGKPMKVPAKDVPLPERFLE
jgi:hypothetical protein